MERRRQNQGPAQSSKSKTRIPPASSPRGRSSILTHPHSSSILTHPHSSSILTPRAHATLQQPLLLPLSLLLFALSLSLTPSPSHALPRITETSHRQLRYPHILPKANLRGPTPRQQPTRFPNSTIQYNDAGQLSYWGGPQMVNSPAPVYVVYYGNWGNATKDKGRGLIKNFIDSINASSPSGPGSVAAWWRINSLYAQFDGRLVSDRVVYGGEVYDNYTQGDVFQDDLVATTTILKNLFRKGVFPASSRAYYAILTSPDVKVTGFCTQYCGFHDMFAYTPPRSRRKTSIYYAFVGNPFTQCPDTCPSLSKGPNPKFKGLDTVIDTLAHELAEIATDPDTLTGWLTSTGREGMENADLCRRNFLTPKVAGRGRNAFSYTLTGLNKARYLVQSNYDPVQAKCVMFP